MPRTYSSFLIRTWGFEDGRQRVEIAHIQSGDCVRTASMDEAIAWLEAHREGLRDPDLPAKAPDDNPFGMVRNG